MAADESRMKEIKKKNVDFLGFTQMQHQQQKMMEQSMRITQAQQKNLKKK